MIFTSVAALTFIRTACRIVCVCLLTVFSLTLAVGQTGRGHILYGDLKVDETRAVGARPVRFDLILYNNGRRVGHQSVVNNSRYRFMDLVNGQYEIVVEVENKEVARIPLLISEIHETDIRHDIELEWTESPIVSSGKKSAVDAAEIYERTSTNTKRFENAEKAIDAKDYGQAQSLLRQILREDEKDYQTWSELGTAYVLQKNLDQAEKAYQRATEINPAFFLAFVNLGKLRLAQDKFEAAIEPLTQAVTIKPDSAQANFLLGEAYLRIKKGSKAVGYLYEALKLEPIEMAEAHLRLAALYNGAGLKDKAAEEYEEFLKKKPDYPDRKKLEQYITQNKKQ